MNKFYAFIVSFVVVLSIFIFDPSAVKADDALLSSLVKKEANQYCSFSTASLPTDETSSLSTEEEPTFEASALSSFVSKSFTSKSGSKIILPIGQFKNYGYCHIYAGHMKRANGSLSYKTSTDSKTQFQYAFYPSKTMLIAEEVINNQDTLIATSDPDRFLKEIYSPIAKQKIRVVIHRGSDFGFGNYNWVIVSMYPRF